MGRRCCGDVGHASGLFLPCIKNCRMKAFPLAARKCTDVHFRQVEWWAYAILAAFSLERLLYVYVWLNPVVWMKVELPCLCMCSHTSGGVNANTFILCFFCVFQFLAKFEGFFCFFVFSPGFFFLDFFSIWKNSTFWPDFCLRITSKCGCTIKYFLEEGEIFLNQSPPAEKCQSWAFSSRDSHKFMQRITTNNHEPAQIWGFSKILIKNTDHR